MMYMDNNVSFKSLINYVNMKEFKRFDLIYIDNKEYRVETVTIRDTFVIVKLEGVDTCEQAETFRNKKVYADMEVQVEDNFDLMNFQVILKKTLRRIL